MFQVILRISWYQTDKNVVQFDIRTKIEKISRKLITTIIVDKYVSRNKEIKQEKPIP